MTEATGKHSTATAVIGVVAIVFATLGALTATATTALWNDGAEHVGLSHVGAYGYWIPLSMALALMVFSVHVGAGVALLRRSSKAARWLVVYGVVAVAVVIGDFVLSLSLLPPDVPEDIEVNAIARLALTVVGIPWALACLVLSRLRFVREVAAIESTAEVAPPEPRDDFEALKLHPAMRSAGTCSVITGLVALLLSVQTAGLLVRWDAVTGASVGLMVSLGIAWMGLGSMQLRMRGWASRVAVATCGVGFLMALGWMAFSVIHGLFSVVALALIPLTLGSAWLARRADGPGRLADEARQRLDDQGLSAGV